MRSMGLMGRSWNLDHGMPNHPELDSSGCAEPYQQPAGAFQGFKRSIWNATKNGAREKERGEEGGGKERKRSVVAYQGCRKATGLRPPPREKNKEGDRERGGEEWIKEGGKEAIRGLSRFLNGRN